MTKPKIEIKLVVSGFLTRWPCHVCGGCTEKNAILCEAEIGHSKLRVCEQCLRAGNIDERLEENARWLEDRATWIRELIGRLIVPTYAEWEEREYQADFMYASQTDDVEADRQYWINRLKEKNLEHLGEGLGAKERKREVIERLIAMPKADLERLREDIFKSHGDTPRASATSAAEVDKMIAEIPF